ncbi:hypothetical protein HDU78_004425 [Chytriomyces hyalinus]|nr:hypothetical protein HDU78_004425 [Chytriomyces hyalinus]
MSDVTIKQLASEYTEQPHRRSELFIRAVSMIVGHMPDGDWPLAARFVAEKAAQSGVVCESVGLIAGALETRGGEINPAAIDALASLITCNALTDKERDAAVVRVAKMGWPDHLALKLAAAFCDLSLSSIAHELVTARVVACMKTCKDDQFTGFLRYLLILAKAGQQRNILLAIISKMRRMDMSLGDSDDDDWSAGNLATAKVSAIRLEGSCILQISFAVRQNKELGQELLSWFKERKGKEICTISFSLLLAMSQIHRFESQTIDILKATFISACKDSLLHHATSAWAPKSVRTLVQPIQIWSILKRTIQKSVYWDNLTPVLTQFAFILVDVDPVSINHHHRLVFEQDAHKMVWRSFDLGVWILLELCRQHHGAMARVVLTQLLSKIVAKPVTAVISCSYLLENLMRQYGVQLVQQHPQLVASIQDCLNAFGGSCSDASGSGDAVREDDRVAACRRFLWAISPVFADASGAVGGSNLKEGLLIGLRKAMFSRETGVRKMAIETLMHTLKVADRPGESGSQSNTGAAQTEVFYILQRGFNQQCDIKCQLYEGFLEIVELQPWLASGTLDIFTPQFLKYYEASKAIRAPLKLEICVAGPLLKEPLPALMALLVRCMIEAKESQFDVSEQEEVMDDILDRLVKADLADFEIEKDVDYTSNSDDGKRNKSMVELLIGMYQVSMEYAMIETEFGDERVDLIVSLNRKLNTVKSFLKEKLKSKRGFGSKQVATVYSSGISTRLQMLVLLFDKPAVVKLRANDELAQQVVSDTYAVLNKMIENNIRGTVELAEQFKSLGRILFCCIMKKTNPAVQAVKTPDRAIFCSAVECFEKLFSYILTHMPDAVESLFADIVPMGESCEEQIDLFCREIRDLLAEILGANTPYTRESVLLVKCLSDLWTFLDRIAPSTSISYEPHKLKQLGAGLQKYMFDTWKSGLCLDALVSKALVGFMCKLQLHASNFLILQSSIEAIQGHFGVLIEDEGDSQNGANLGDLADKDIAAATLLMLACLDECVEQVRWMSGKIKFLQEDEARLQMESAICKQTSFISIVLYQLLRSELPLDASDAVFSSMIKLFRVVNGFLRYKGTSSDCSPRFDEMVQVVSSKLRDALNEVIPILQERDVEEAPENAKKGASMLIKKRKRSARESKTMPTLIFETEQFDRYLIALHKKLKINLMKYVKRSTARDFKISDKTKKVVHTHLL